MSTIVGRTAVARRSCARLSERRGARMLARSLSTTNDSSSSSSSSSSFSVDDLYDVPLADVRNFCVLAHVDHGKSSLAARLLECAGNRAPSSDRDGVDALDTLSVERERGITVKATAASMAVHHPRATGQTGRMLLNMVDTPGHADFGSEVTRSLAASQGGVLLFDASQGVQAQTFSVHDKARRMGVRLIPALTKVDLPTADPVEVALSVSDLFGFDPDAVLLTSARANVGVREVLDAVCDLVPPPAPLRGDDGVLRARVVDSWFEPLHGVVCLVQIASGTLSEGDRVVAVAPGAAADAADLVARPARDVGVLVPDRVRTGTLRRGQMGYAVVGARDPRAARPGSVLVRGRDAATDARTFFAATDVAVDDARPSSSALYASVHPAEGDTIDTLRDAVDRLALNDAGLEVRATSGASSSSSSSSGGGPFLGPGIRVGFQGPLHAEVFRQRLRDEFDVDAVVTPPKVPYRVTRYGRRGARAAETTTSIVEDLSEWPSPAERYEVEEPVVRLRVLAPSRHAGDVTELVHRRRGRDVESGPLGADVDHGVSSTSSTSSSSFVNDWILTARVPWAEVVTDLHEELKNRTSGHASFDYDDDDATTDFQPADLVKVDVTLNDETVGPLAFVAHRDEARARGRVVCSRLKEVLPRRQFVTVIRAVADGNRILASERVRAYRKDVLVKSGKNVGGGDVTRKKKLLEKQKKGKKRQQETGRVTLTQAAFNSVVGRSS